MRSRGGALKGRRAFSIYRFDNRDRVYVTAMFAAAAATSCGAALGYCSMLYDPKIVPPQITPVAVMTYAAYLIFCLMPLSLDLFTEYRFRAAREKCFEI